MDAPVSPTFASAHAPFDGLPIEIKVCVGSARPRLGTLMGMAAETILPLDTRVSDPVSLYVADQLIAHGELVELEGEGEGALAVRITRVAGTEDGRG